jgi:quinol monooxygenase YgiN
MMDQTGTYMSGSWNVKHGKEDAFVQAWTDALEWTMKVTDGAAQSFTLIRDENDPQRFLSFGAWRDKSDVKAWRELPDLPIYLGRIKDLCEDFELKPYSIASEVN